MELRTGMNAVLERLKAHVGGSERTLSEVINTHENNFNIVRLILAASVIYFHAPYIAGENRADWISRHLLYPVTSLGGMAVQCFFFLSGIFVTQSIFKDRSLIDYSIKRIMRIFPGLFVCVLLTTVLLLLASNGLSQWIVFKAPDAYAFILHNASLNLQWSLATVLTHNPVSAINGSIHTLPTELKMYVMLGLLGALGLTTKPLRIFASAGLIVVAMAAVGSPVTAVWGVPSDAYSMVFLFVAGMLVYALADWIVIRPGQGIGLAVLLYLCKGVLVLKCISMYAFVMWLMLYVGQSRCLRKVFKPRSDPSYGVYIYGWPSQQLVKALIPSAGSGLIAGLALPIAFGFAMLSWIYIERPSMDAARAISKNQNKLKALKELFAPGESWSISIYLQCALLAFCVAMLVVTSEFDLISYAPMQVHIVQWGPIESTVGHGFNVQADGGSTLWLKLDGAPAQSSVVIFDGHRLNTTVNQAAKTVAAGVPRRLLRNVGRKPIFIQSIGDHGGFRSNVVYLNLVK